MDCSSFSSSSVKERCLDAVEAPRDIFVCGVDSGDAMVNFSMQPWGDVTHITCCRVRSHVIKLSCLATHICISTTETVLVTGLQERSHHRTFAPLEGGLEFFG